MVGIAASALYRHFRGKQELLLAVIDQHLSVLEEMLKAPGDELFDRLAAFGLEHREFGVLWDRESRHLIDSDRRAAAQRLTALATVVGRVGDVVPGDDEGTERRAWAALSVLGSLSRHHVNLAAPRVAALLRAAVQDTLSVPVPPSAGSDVYTGPPLLRPASRREALLGAAIELCSRHGFPSVGLHDIGAVVGITGPSVYNHFGTKADVLVAALRRGDEALWLGLHHALAGAEDPAAALNRLIADYARFAMADPGIVTILVSEIIHLPADRQSVYRRTQRDYVSEWAVLLAQARPELSDDQTRVLVHAALGVINSLSRIPRLCARTDHAAHCVALARAVLDAGRESPGTERPPPG